MLASLGCGNPTALAELKPGEIVLDLGSGGGIDVLLSAKRVGPTGKAYGLDMTDEMLALARENQRKAGVTNVEFLKGEIEQHPAARQLGRRHHLELRHQPVGRQGQGPARGVPRAEARRPLRRVGRRRARRDSGRDPSQRRAVGRLPRRRARRVSDYVAKLARGGLRGDLHRADAHLQGRGRARVPLGARASTWTPSRRWWTAGSSAASSAPGSRRSRPGRHSGGLLRTKVPLGEEQQVRFGDERLEELPHLGPSPELVEHPEGRPAAGPSPSGDSGRLAVDAGPLVQIAVLAAEHFKPRSRSPAGVARQLIPGPPIEQTASLLLVRAAPLLEEERHAGGEALIADVDYPGSAPSAVRRGPDSPPTIDPMDASQIEVAQAAPSSGSRESEPDPAPVRRR